MRPVYISVRYLKLIIGSPRRMAILGSPARFCGGWITVYPTRKPV